MPRPLNASHHVDVLDLFAGPGGLGEGFSGLRLRGRHPFRIALSVEKEPWAQQTLELRTFYRQFLDTGIPKEYWRHLENRLSRDDLYAAYPEAARTAIDHAKIFEMGEGNRRTLERRIDALSLDADRTIVIGGPPCQAYSLAGRSRNGAIAGWSLETDARSQLYKEYLHVLAHAQPAAFVMENVRGLLSARINGVPLFGQIMSDLHAPAGARGGGRRYRLLPLAAKVEGAELALDPLFQFSPDAFLVRAEEHGIPQARHRIIIVGIAEDRIGASTKVSPLDPPDEDQTVEHALQGLPRVRSALSKGPDSHMRWIRSLQAGLKSDGLRSAEKSVRDAMRQAVDQAAESDPGRGAEVCRVGRGPRDLVLNHVARTHMESDLHRYLFAASFSEVHGRTPTLDDFPEALLPDHANVKNPARNGAFNDRFRVQCWNAPSTTIVSHIAKDGHYYIHPDSSQCRSLTVREAARLQTFPDDYLFCGPKTAQYQQVGNAVPFRLAKQIARVVAKILE